LVFCVFVSSYFLCARGGLQQIPLTINSAYFANNSVVNDLSVNSFYYFGKSLLLYNRADGGIEMPDIETSEAEITVAKMLSYQKEHSNYILKNNRPNVVFVILEGWSGNVVGCLNDGKGATPHFDQMAKQGLLFNNLQANGGTSDVGNTSILSGNPAIPELFISMQPEKHRQIHCINQDFSEWGYSSSYLFSGDLKYGNIAGYLLDHGFNQVEDEADFPLGLTKGKLNYYDADLFKLLLKRINSHKEPFFQCVFTGSTHSPYDHPKKAKQDFSGEEADYMNSMIYADNALANFVADCQKENWFKNTLFVFVADHGHPSPNQTNPSTKDFFSIPFLIWGEPLKNEYRGDKISTLGSQSDIAATLLYQFGGDLSRYPWSKDLLNPNVPQFALHTITRGYGWMTPKGSMVYHFDLKDYVEKSFLIEDEKQEIKKGHAYLKKLYLDYENL
jgi:phosphoglycerol transferase MdoB-like AlkP superfamily enzyme